MKCPDARKAGTLPSSPAPLPRPPLAGLFQERPNLPSLLQTGITLCCSLLVSIVHLFLSLICAGMEGNMSW